MSEITRQIEARFLELGVKVETSEIEAKLEQLINKFRSAGEARRNVINYFLKKHNIPKSEFFTRGKHRR